MNDTRKKPASTRIGKIIRAELAKLDRGQAWLSRQIGDHESRVSEWISGARLPSAESLAKTAKALGVPLSRLRGRSGK